MKANATSRAEQDAKRYRDRYPGQKEEKGTQNAQFYANKIKSKPSGDYIDEIHKKWRGDYERLEEHHGYIQWLFPIREQGLNGQAQPLTLKEIDEITADKDSKNRVVKSYELMLDFYGMRLKSPQTGELEKIEKYQKRYANLNYSGHNWLRITRILKCLGELGYEKLKAPFCEFVMTEIFEQGELIRTATSLKEYWIPVLRNDDERQRLLDKYESFEKRNQEKRRKPESSSSTQTSTTSKKDEKKTEVQEQKKEQKKDDNQKAEKDDSKKRENHPEDDSPQQPAAKRQKDDKNEEMKEEKKESNEGNNHQHTDATKDNEKKDEDPRMEVE